MINQVYSNLTVIEKYTKSNSYNLVSEYSKSKENNLYICKCSCNTYILSTDFALTSSKTRSCKNCKQKELLNTKFTKLTPIIYKDNHWICRCDCGNYTKTKYKLLKRQNTKSCGCLVSIASTNTLSKINKIHPNPSLESAKIIHSKRYQDGCSFEFFHKTSQLNCYYCNNEPLNNYNAYLHGSYSQDTKQRGNFIYNGLDRIDSSKNHSEDNLVPCCKYCNTMKSNSNQNDFYTWINSILNNQSVPKTTLLHLDIPTNITNLVKEVYRFYNTDISINEFYYLTQLNCFYCNKSSSKSNCHRKKYFYNGLDRIDSNFNHVKDNLVTCCKACNWAKSNYTYEFFINHLTKIKLFLGI